MKKDLNIVFMGTPEFASWILLRLIEEGYGIASVFTQPDKKVGRKQILLQSPVKQLARKHKIPVMQPENLREKSVAEQIRKHKPCLIVVAAYGKILSKEILAIPEFCAINVHASLLPKYRGASPIQEALLNGDDKTGVTLMRMDEGLDTGDILFQKEIKIDRDDTSVELEKKLSKLGADLLATKIPQFMSGDIVAVPQDSSKASYCRIVSRDDGKIDWKEPAEIILRKFKAYQPWPGIFTTFKGKRLKLTDIAAQVAPTISEKPGKVIEYSHHIGVVAGKGLVKIKKIQYEGKKEMPAVEFLRGRGDFLGSILS